LATVDAVVAVTDTTYTTRALTQPTVHLSDIVAGRSCDIAHRL